MGKLKKDEESKLIFLIGFFISFIGILLGSYLGYSALHNIDLAFNAHIYGNYEGIEIGCNLFECGIEMTYEQLYIESMQGIIHTFFILIFSSILLGFVINNQRGI